MEFLRELEESYHVEIHTEGIELTDMRITTTYREQSIDAILETIGAAFNLKVTSGEDALPEIPVTVSSRSRTINQVLDEITLQTGYYFTYDALW